MILLALLDDDLQLCVLGVSSGPPPPLPGVAELDTDEAEPKWRANLGDDDVKLANNARVLMSKTCILKCCGMPPSYPSLQSISNDDNVWLEMEQFLGGSGTPARDTTTQRGKSSTLDFRALSSCSVSFLLFLVLLFPFCVRLLFELNASVIGGHQRFKSWPLVCTTFDPPHAKPLSL